MFLDLAAARRAHSRALRLWSEGKHQAACVREDAGIQRLRRHQRTHPASTVELNAMLLARSQFARTLTDHKTARDVLNHLLLNESIRQSDPANAVATRLALGDTCRLLANHADAHRLLTEALTIAIEADNMNLQALAENALGILAKDQGRYADAERHYHAALYRHQGLPTQDPAFLAAVHHNLAGLAHARGTPAEGEGPARRAIDLRITAGGTATEIAADRTVLAAILIRQNRLDEAESLLHQSLGAWSATYGNDHYEVAVNLHNLAALQRQRGDLVAAEGSARRALAIKRNVLTEIHPEIAALYSTLAGIQSDADGRTTDATANYRLALDIYQRTLGADHPTTKKCLQNLRMLQPEQEL